jgi:hypothetical protein
MNPFCPSVSLRLVPGGKTGMFNRHACPALSIVMLLVFLVCAGPASTWGAVSGQREALIASLPKGDVFDNDGQTYVWLPTLRAKKETSGNSTPGISRDPASEVGSDGSTGEFLEKRGLFSIYKPAPASSAAGMETANAVSEHPVVLNQRIRTLGVLTRRLWLKLKEMRDTDGIAKEYGMTLSFSNAAMGTSFYEVPEGIDLQALRTRLLSDPRIVRVTLEVIDRIHRPQ